ncbi:hypothetical protein [Streptomyces sp. TLI_171]|uniref:hypothetical protein n=1 Tax=Streptomyces sp. TLI_171 TaxID=1938859 RepID=UPI000C17E462|nr:hypothetical protein [Streptomyces sp. TLI_171]RKE16905.1 hypothetical protein BX266_0151 [Streptomyces sp. TLI_171]
MSPLHRRAAAAAAALALGAVLTATGPAHSSPPAGRTVVTDPVVQVAPDRAIEAEHHRSRA